MSDSIEKNSFFPEQKYNIVVTSSNNINSSQLISSEMTHPNSQPEQVCVVIADPNQSKQLGNSLLSVQNMIPYNNSFVPSLYYIGHDIPSTTSPALEPNISVVTPSKAEIPNINNLGIFPTSFLPPQSAKKIQSKPIFKPKFESLPSSTSSSEAISERMLESSGHDHKFKMIDKRLRVVEGLLKKTIKYQKKTARHQERMELFFQQFVRCPDEQTMYCGSNRSVHLQRPVNEVQPLIRISNHPETIAVTAYVDSSSSSNSPPVCFENQKDDPNSPNLMIDVNSPILLDGVGLRSPHKYHSHSCSMYNKSIRDFSDSETMQWLDNILPILGRGVTVEKIQEVLSQTNTITHFTAEFQKVVFTNNERKTLTTSGKFRKRKLERIVLGPLDTAKLQGIIQLSLYLFGVTDKDVERVKYQLKQAIDEKNRREFYREDRGTKRVHLSSIPN